MCRRDALHGLRGLAEEHPGGGAKAVDGRDDHPGHGDSRDPR